MKLTELYTRVYRGERNFVGADLSNVEIPNLPLVNCDFRRADFRGTVFQGTLISECDFSYANMRGCQVLNVLDVRKSLFVRADFSHALLRNSQFSGCDFTRAYFDYAHLNDVWLRQVDLTWASLCDARWRDVVSVQSTVTRCAIAGAVFDDCDISDFGSGGEIRISAEKPVVIDFRTVCRSLRSPALESFLLACNMPGLVVTYLLDCAHALDPKMLMSLLQSTFISYGAPDEAFARRLRDELHRSGVKTFFFQTDAIPGERIHDVMHDQVNKHDRVILICSQASLTRPGVRTEIQETLDREARDGGANYLIPVAIDGFLLTWQDPLANRIRNRVIADFREALTDYSVTDEADGRSVRVPPSRTAFQNAIQTLIHALKRKQPAV